MASLRPEQRTYARDEMIADGLVHGTAILAALCGCALLLAHSVASDIGKAAALIIYLVALLTMLCCSAAYNLTPVSPAKWFLRRFDHSAIYLMIAATYTPLLIQLPDTKRAAILGITVWVGAVIGIAIKMFLPGRYDKFAVATYLALGWVGLFAASSFVAVLPQATLLLILAGGLLYSAGVPFYLWEKLKFQTAIWHAFVAAAAATHFVAIAELYL